MCVFKVLCVFVLISVVNGWNLPIGEQFKDMTGPKTHQKETIKRQSDKIYYQGPTSQKDLNKDFGTITIIRRPPPQVNDIQDEEDQCTLTSEPPEPDSQCCGVEASSNLLIVGGNATQLEKYPWLAVIEYYNKAQNRSKKLCGGFLISGRFVLSAAHCFVGDDVEAIGTPVNVILGDYNITNEGPDCAKSSSGEEGCTDGAITVPIEKVIVHPKYLFDNISIYNDIALVKLKHTVAYTKFIRPICLPTSDITEDLPANLRLYSAGWGAIKQRLVFELGMKKFAGEYDNVKRHVDLPLRDLELCREKLGNFVNKRHLCAGGERGKDSCRGDSGTPLMYERDGTYVAAGLVSTGAGKHGCGTEGYPALYTNVYQYVDWIRESIKANDFGV